LAQSNKIYTRIDNDMLENTVTKAYVKILCCWKRD